MNEDLSVMSVHRDVCGAGLIMTSINTALPYLNPIHVYTLMTSINTALPYPKTHISKP